MRALWMVVFLVGCPGTSDLSDACRLAAEGGDCPECADGDVTCTLDGVEVTEMSCGGCQARVALIAALCDAGSTVTEEEIEAEGVCVP
jgi:hypothetical protein